MMSIQYVDGISETCFGASYLIVLGLEFSRLVVRVPVRFVVIILLLLAGLLAQTIFLGMHAAPGFQSGTPLSSWWLWCHTGAWLLAVNQVFLTCAKPRTPSGVFLLPLVLGLIVVAMFADKTPFSSSSALARWGMLHGVSLLLGTTVAAVGFVLGAMYLVQSAQLKAKVAPSRGLKLPSLEWLQSANRWSLVLSSVLTAVGVVGGVIMNRIRHSQTGQGLPWTDPVVATSSLLFLWLLATLIFEAAYRPAQQGRKVAYLTMASFVFVFFAVFIAMFSASEHTSERSVTRPTGANVR